MSTNTEPKYWKATLAALLNQMRAKHPKKKNGDHDGRNRNKQSNRSS